MTTKLAPRCNVYNLHKIQTGNFFFFEITVDGTNISVMALKVLSTSLNAVFVVISHS